MKIESLLPVMLYTETGGDVHGRPTIRPILTNGLGWQRFRRLAPRAMLSAAKRCGFGTIHRYRGFRLQE
jgi:hypothetical protein